MMSDEKNFNKMSLFKIKRFIKDLNNTRNLKEKLKKINN